MTTTTVMMRMVKITTRTMTRCTTRLLLKTITVIQVDAGEGRYMTTLMMTMITRTKTTSTTMLLLTIIIVRD